MPIALSRSLFENLKSSINFVICFLTISQSVFMIIGWKFHQILMTYIQSRMWNGIEIEALQRCFRGSSRSLFENLESSINFVILINQYSFLIPSLSASFTQILTADDICLYFYLMCNQISQKRKKICQIVFQRCRSFWFCSSY